MGSVESSPICCEEKEMLGLAVFIKSKWERLAREIGELYQPGINLSNKKGIER